MPTAIPLSTAIEEYLDSRRSRGVAPNTLKSDRSQLNRFLAHVGNIQTRNLEERHVDSFFASLGHQKESSRNLTLTKIRGFFRWCKNRDYMSRDLTVDRARIREPENDRTLVPVERFPELLDACEHPGDRIVVALGLYLFLRVSEIQTLRVGDVDLDEGTIQVTVHKSKLTDTMPICAELDEELRHWLAWYAANIEGPLQGDMYLVPTKKDFRNIPGPNGKFIKGRSDTARHSVFPYKRRARPHHSVQKALAAIGVPTRGEGGHTLRRSGARAFFDVERTKPNAEGGDGALQQVKVMLHHKNASMTERYLQLRPEREKRDQRLRGRKMFPERLQATDNVVNLDERRDVGDQAGSDM